MDGLTLTRRLKADAATAVIPIVVLSGDANVDYKAADLGAADLLRKPISLKSVLELIARFD